MNSELFIPEALASSNAASHSGEIRTVTLLIFFHPFGLIEVHAQFLGVSELLSWQI
jgi:hypothetical protein